MLHYSRKTSLAVERRIQIKEFFFGSASLIRPGYSIGIEQAMYLSIGWVSL